VNLLYGKRPIQRFEVGAAKHKVEAPLSVVEEIYKDVESGVSYHNGDYNPLQWKDFVAIKTTARHLYEAAKSPEPPKSALTDLDWYQKISSLYAGHQTLNEVDVFKAVSKPKFVYPFLVDGGKNSSGTSS